MPKRSMTARERVLITDVNDTISSNRIELHHPRIGIHRREGIAIIRAPLSGDKTFGFEFNNVGHSEMIQEILQIDKTTQVQCGALRVIARLTQCRFPYAIQKNRINEYNQELTDEDVRNPKSFWVVS